MWGYLVCEKRNWRSGAFTPLGMTRPESARWNPSIPPTPALEYRGDALAEQSAEALESSISRMDMCKTCGKTYVKTCAKMCVGGIDYVDNLNDAGGGERGACIFQQSLLGGGWGASTKSPRMLQYVCMYVWSSHIARVRINRVRLPILLVVS